MLPPALTRVATLVLALASTASALSNKAQRYALKSAAAPDHIVKLDSASFDDLTGDKERDYGVTVVLTALDPGFKCAPCREFEPAFKTIATSWARLSKDQRSKHIFGSLEFKDGQAIYKRLGLSAAPTVWYFPPTVGDFVPENTDMEQYELNRMGFSVESLREFLLPRVPHEFKIYRPLPWGKIITGQVAVILGGYALFKGRHLILPIATSRYLWMLITLLIVLTFTTGYMWNKIKDAPYMAVDREGRSQWLAGGFSNQYGAESQIIAVIYGTLAFAFVALTTLVPSIRDPARQRIGVFLWTSVVVIVFSILMSIFKMKNGGYPFRLLL